MCGNCLRNQRYDSRVSFIFNLFSDWLITKLFSQSFPELTAEEVAETYSEDMSSISNALRAATLPSLNLPAQSSDSNYYQQLDLSALISTRREHETKRSAKSTRIKVVDDSEVDPSDAPEKPISMRRQILKAINETLREDQQKRINTGANRLNTWTSTNKLSAPGGRSAEQVESLQGNSLNAELAAGARAAQVREKDRDLQNPSVTQFSRLSPRVERHSPMLLEPLSLNPMGSVMLL